MRLRGGIARSRSIAALIVLLILVSSLATTLLWRPASAWQEESLGPEELPATPMPSPGLAQINGSPGASPIASPIPQAVQYPANPVPLGLMTPVATPTDSVPLEVGAVQARSQISDAPLTPIIASASNPARSASLRATEQARIDLLNHDPASAIQTLGRAISIDPSNPYAYFYLGRAWLDKKNYDQAATFLNRAETGFATNPDWTSESAAYEGLAEEQAGKTDLALAAYQRALQSEPGNLMARVGYTRLAPQAPVVAGDTTGASNGSGIETPPQEAPPATPPATLPPPID
jgi:Flp pilus assembly protein TadD